MTREKQTQDFVIGYSEIHLEMVGYPLSCLFSGVCIPTHLET